VLDKQKLMELFELNEQQLEAVDITRNISVSAGAGSGKTRLLVARFLLLLLEDDGVEMDNIAAVTFTNKAALEMKERIRSVIDRCIRTDRDDGRTRWYKYKEDLFFANINTIHGLCSTIIRENAGMLGIDPNFSVMDDVDRIMVQRDISRSVVKKYTGDPTYSQQVRQLVRMYDTGYITSGRLAAHLVAILGKALELGLSLDDIKKDAGPHTVEFMLCSMVEEINALYRDYKYSRGMLDFTDLETLTLKLLKNPSIRTFYRDRFKRFLVDEFQDTNKVQKEIIYSLVTGDDGRLLDKRLFIVGDLKQSIYGFRGTDYKIFEQVTRDMGPGSQRTLDICYRSLPEVIQSINVIFQPILKGYRPLKAPAGARATGRTAVELITYNPPKKEEDPAKAVKDMIKAGEGCDIQILKEGLKRLREELDKQPPAADPEARVIAQRIAKLVDTEGYAYKDISILVRSRYKVPVYEQQLAAAGIPYCLLGGKGLYEKQEIVDILSLYKFIVCPEDLVSFITAMRSPLFCIPDDMLARLMNEYVENKLDHMLDAFEYVIETLDEGDDGFYYLNRAHDILSRLMKEKGYLNTTGLLETIIDRCEVMQVLATQSHGPQRLVNVEKLLGIARRFEAKGMFKPQQFNEYLDTMDEQVGDEGEGALDTEDSDAVKIMTIHGAKGLEFDVVIVPSIDSECVSRMKRWVPPLVLDEDLGLIAGGTSQAEQNPKFDEYLSRQAQREIDENNRIYYVAMTRAKKLCILIAKNKDCSKDFKKQPLVLDSFYKQLRYVTDVEGVNIPYFKEVLWDPDFLPGAAYAGHYDKWLDDLDINLIAPRLDYKCQEEAWLFTSPSRYLDYLKCPRGYYFKYVALIDGLEETGGILAEAMEEQGLQHPETVGGDVMGTMVHDILRRMVQEGLPFNTAFDRSVKGRPGLSGKDVPNCYAQIKRYVDNFLSIDGQVKDLMEGQRVKTLCEYSFSYLPHPGKRVVIGGSVDRVDVYRSGDKNTALIIDYKTNRVEDAGDVQTLARYYGTQLKLYARAVGNLLYIQNRAIDEIRMMLYLLDCGRWVEVPYDDRDIDRMTERMYTDLSGGAGDGGVESFPTRQGQHCMGCSYKVICDKAVMVK